MDCSRFFFGGVGEEHQHQHQHQHQLPPPQPSPKKTLQLQGPRPTPLRVNRDSHVIRKPPRHPKAQPAEEDPRQPVIIYAVSPKVIHVQESDFMSLVQRLTGQSPSGPRAGDVSPAARFASIEKSSSSPSSRPLVGINGVVGGGDQATTSSAVEGLDLAAARGILSPAPSSLLAIPSGFFSPPAVPLFPDLVMSPLYQGGSGFMGGSSGRIVSSPSASAWFSSSMIAPSPTSLDLYNLLSDF